MATTTPEVAVAQIHRVDAGAVWIAEQGAEQLRAEVVRRGAGSITESDQSDTAERVRSAKGQMRAAQHQLRNIDASLAWNGFRIWIDSFSTKTGTPVFVLSLGLGILLLAFGLLVAVPLGLTMFPAISVAIASFAAGFSLLPMLCGLVPLATAQGRYQVASAQRPSSIAAVVAGRSAHQDALLQFNHIESLLRLREEFESKRILAEQLRREFNDRKNQLRLIDWRSLRGVPFELFLVDVFTMLGYVVETTKTSGDQGVDLIVTKNGMRTAIQVKGYEGSVGNGAVQEAFAGKAHYRCQHCAVITNSYFSRSATELANSTGCVLIDGTRLPDLIAGRLL
jgi:HJR/Mrr/RecB family endonuclease